MRYMDMYMYNLDVIIFVGYKESKLEQEATTEESSVVQYDGCRSICGG